MNHESEEKLEGNTATTKPIDIGPYFFGIWVIISVFFFWHGIASYLEAEATRKWPAVEGRIISSGIDGKYKSENEKVMYAPDVVYSYSVQGKEYSGDRIFLARKSSNDSRYAQKIKEQYRDGDYVKVFYNKADPSQSLLVSGPCEFTWFFLIGSSISLVISVWGLVHVLYWMRRQPSGEA